MNSHVLRSVVLVMLIGAVTLVCTDGVVAQTCPELIGRWPYGPATAVAIDGNTAYLGSGTVLLVLDVSTPATPLLLGEIVLPDVVRGVAVEGNHAYVALGDSGLRVVDVSILAAPVGVGDIDTPGFANDVTVDSNHAYVADGSSGLRVISISNPASPTQVGFLDTASDALGVAVAGDLVYVADGYGGLVIISVANPALPTTEGALDTSGYARDLVIVSPTWPMEPRGCA